MNRTRHLRTLSRDSPVRAATRVSGATPPSSAQASTTRARSASDCDAVRFRDKASSDARSASDKTSGTSFGLGTRQAYNLQSFQRLRTLDGFQVPVGAQKPAVWKAAFVVMAAPPPKDTAVFLHCDLLPVNMLWSRGRITGLTDWNSIYRGARAIDVGHCGRYLAALYSPEWSEQLRSLYESIAGVTLDPWWDLYALLHYDDCGPKWIRSQVAGRRPVDVPGMTSRVEVAIETALRRLG
jgi:hypothetical protein